MGVYEKVSVDEAFKITDKPPIAVRWVDVNKGDRVNPKYRSRLVAKEFSTDVNHDLYAATQRRQRRRRERAKAKIMNRSLFLWQT